MKFLVFGLALLIAGATAFPEKVQVAEIEGLNERNFVDNLKRIIEAFKRLIIDNKFDPWVIARHERDIVRLPYLNIQYFIEDMEFSGASNIVIHNLEYSNLFSRFRFDLELPHLAFSLGSSGLSGLVLSKNVNAGLSGSLKVSGIRLAGEAYVNVDLLTGSIDILTLNAKFALAEIESVLEIVLQENNHSEKVNIFLNDTLLAWLKSNESDINRVISTVIKFVAQLILNRN